MTQIQAQLPVPKLSGRVRSLWSDYWELAKPEITLLVVVAALGGFILGSPERVDYALLLSTLVGTALCSAGSGMFNHYLERHHDSVMRRTAQRPLPSGRRSPAAVLMVGGLLVTGGMTTLWTVNLLTCLLAVATVGLYLGAYTPLKRLSSLNTLVGTIPGALPALGGFTAGAGTFGAAGWALFAILALWQMPHFLALAWIYRKDYARAGYRMLPVVRPKPQSTTRRTLVYTLLLVAVSVLPTLIGATGWIYLGAAVLTGGWFLAPVMAFCSQQTAKAARRVVRASVLYIPVLVLGMALDRWIL
ncbi:MAG: heme o synthase [Bacteroidota bacterium]|nr:heme o synthase [Bacteroidota bacterium]MDE2833130.1 heme o synthase [Bacteroidota bacterium]